MHWRGGIVIRLLMALTILVSVVLRPPGTMVVIEGEMLSYVLCTGGEPKTIQVPLDDTVPSERDLSCDFFTSQIANLTGQAIDVPRFEYLSSYRATVAQPAIKAKRRLWHPNIACAPPVTISSFIYT
ncbi:MAG: hypothetical protein ABJT05_10505 [Paracoccaceae bacterium]